MKTSKHITPPPTTREDDIQSVEMQIKYLEGELDRLAFPIASRICNLIHFAIIEQMIHESKGPVEKARML